MNREIRNLFISALPLLTLLLALAAIPACGQSKPPVSNANFDSAICAPTEGPFSTTIDNPYLPFDVGAVHELEGLEGGTSLSAFTKEFLAETREVAGVTTRVVQKTSYDLGVLVSVERQFLAQAADGTVCCFGEEEEIFENDAIVDTDGYVVGAGGVKPSVFMPGAPEVGMVFEIFLDNSELQTGEVTALAVQTVTPAGTFDDTLTVLEASPQEAGVSLKKYARGLGEIFDDGIELISY